MIECKLERVAENDPLRCQSSGQYGQCPYRAVEGSKYCARHSSDNDELAKKKASLRNYRLGQYQARVGEFANSDAVKSLREEIGILRMTLEHVIAQAKTPVELVIYSGKVTDLIIRIEKLVTSCHRLEMASGDLLDKTKALQLAGSIVEIVGRYVKDGETMDLISNEILISFTSTTGQSQAAGH